MASSCANLATHAVRLRDTQREFFLAWKAVESGDRGTLVEARRAQRELADVHRDIERTLYVAWTPKALERVEKKGQFVFAELLEAQAGDLVVRDLHFHPDGGLLTVYAGERGGRVDIRSHDLPSAIEDTSTLFESRGTITRCIARPDQTLLFIENGELYEKTREDIYHIGDSKGLSMTLHAHHDGRIFAGDFYGNIKIWTPREDGSYFLHQWHAHDGNVKGLHVFADATFVTTGGDGRVKYWRAVEGEMNEWTCEVLEDFILASALHASINGRLAVGTIIGKIYVWERAEDGSMKPVDGFDGEICINDLQVLPDHRIVFVTDGFTTSQSSSVTILALDDHDQYVVEQSFDRGEDDVSYELVCVREDGLIVFTDHHSADIRVLDDDVEKWIEKTDTMSS